MKRINELYQWRKPTPIDNHAELIAFLKSKPRYRDALALRKILLIRHRLFVRWEQETASRPPRSELALF